ncbi:hypothetical protein GGX14DRAFT_560713 [Mycena pura]|uniref:Uncharacterized protein n=1 Tax=Mycena pura TaxID=153505 RepID=A0AAD6YFC0_9AGAR|nr:hypothetical protein GGX14DRAFT_560713 [Mycena pura]
MEDIQLASTHRLSARTTHSVELPNGPFITIVPHPSDIETCAKVIPLSASAAPDDTADSRSDKFHNNTNRIAALADATRPWAPWQTLSDFEYTESAVKGLLSEDVIKAQLRVINFLLAKSGPTGS